MPMRETGKRRAQRIPLDYYKRPDGLLLGKLGLSALALVLAMGWWATGLELRGGRVQTSPAGNLRYSKGPLASVHEAWDSKCDTCHRPFATIDDKRWSPPGLVSKTTSDRQCQSCHQGPAHAASQRAEDVKSCAGCHIDHRGRDASLVRLPDSECTNCHNDLAGHRLADAKPRPKGTEVADRVTSFATDHPPFSNERPGATDPGRLAFNHALHLAPGMAKTPGGRDTKTIAYIADPSLRERYRLKGQADDSPIRLDCASCHVADAGDSRVAASAGRSSRDSGAIMMPIKYENQCRACHALNVDPRSPDIVVPHGLQPPEVKRYLGDAYAGLFLRDNAKLLGTVVPSRPFPGRRLAPEEETVKRQVEEAIGKAEAVLYGGKTTCMECHNPVKPSADGRPTTIEAPNVPDVWLARSHFDHSAHRGVGCLDCHVKATTSTVSTDILVPGIESCRQCHAPASRSATSDAMVGGVRHDCAECHRYHNGDHALQGRGALAEAGLDQRSLTEFLSGTVSDHSAPAK